MAFIVGVRCLRLRSCGRVQTHSGYRVHYQPVLYSRQPARINYYVVRSCLAWTARMELLSRRAGYRDRVRIPHCQIPSLVRHGWGNDPIHRMQIVGGIEILAIKFTFLTASFCRTACSVRWGLTRCLFWRRALHTLHAAWRPKVDAIFWRS